MSLPQSKKCTKCGEEKSIEEFAKNAASKSGIDSRCRACKNQMALDWVKKNPERPFIAMLKRNYDLTIEQFNRMWDSQQGCCQICKCALSRGTGKFAVDHNHVTGTVRAILCGNCNNGLGKFKDSPAVLDSAARYLRTYGFYGSEALEASAEATG